MTYLPKKNERYGATTGKDTKGSPRLVAPNQVEPSNSPSLKVGASSAPLIVSYSPHLQ